MNFEILHLFSDNPVWRIISFVILLFIVIVFAHHLIIFLKFKIKIRIECWFCGEKNFVRLSNRNAWTCISCLQYNGFAKDGSYNKVIKEQHEFNEANYCLKSHDLRYEQHRLCDACNKNQEMKIKLLADFVPLNQNNFNKEVSEFRKHIDSLYKICDNCELLLEKVLEKPSIHSFFKSSPAKPTLNSRNHLKMKSEGILSTVRRYYLLIWNILAFIAILVSLIYLFDLSNHAYIFQQSSQYNIFRKHYSTEHAKIYKEVHFIVAALSLALYSLLVYYGKTFHRAIDITFLGFILILMANHFKFNIFALPHDTLVEFHQWVIFTNLILLIITLIFKCLNVFNYHQSTKSSKSFINDEKRGVRKDAKQAKSFNFARFDDEKVIREQIKDLCLSDFDTNLDESETASTNSTSSIDNVFSLYSKACDLPSNNFLQYEELFNTTNSFSYFKCQFSNSNSVFTSSSSIAAKPCVDSSGFMKKNLYNSELVGMSSKFNQRQNDHGLTANRYSNETPRVLNYYVNCDQPQSRAPQVVVAYSSLSNWLSTMFRTFELILFLVIIGLIVVLLSMPITLSYSSDFNSFELNFAVHNVT